MEIAKRYTVEAFYDNKRITKISYKGVRYFDNNIYKLFDCYEYLEGGELFINYIDISKVVENIEKLNRKEREFVEVLDGYDVVELRFSSYL